MSIRESSNTNNTNIHTQKSMFARNLVRRESRNYAEVMEKTAKYTVGSAGTAAQSAVMYLGIITIPLVMLGVNTAWPSTRRVTDSHGFNGVDHPKNKNAVWQGK